MTGTGGAIALMKDDGNILVTPSGLLKETVTNDDLFTLNLEAEVLNHPQTYESKLKYSSCFPNFQHIFKVPPEYHRNSSLVCVHQFRQDTRAIFHTHSALAVIASLALGPGQHFRCSNLQMVKAMRGHKWSDTVRIPVIGNKDSEDAIAVDLETAVRANPGVDAVIIRGHGLYVWAPTWQMAKVRIEALEWLFEIKIECMKLGLQNIIEN